MTRKKPNFIIKFDDSNPTYEEVKRDWLQLIAILQKLEIESIENSKDVYKKEKKEVLSNIIDDQNQMLKIIDEHFDTILPQVKEKFGQNKPEIDDID